MELIIKSYQATGWLCPITGEDFKRVEEYCKDNDEDIENLCPSASEDIFQEIIDGFDVYEWALNGEDLSLFYTRIIGEFEIYYIKDGKEVNLPLSECTVNKSKVNENDLKDHFGDDKGIAYSFGYSSDEIMEVRLNETVVDEVEQNGKFEAYLIANEGDNVIKITVIDMNNELHELSFIIKAPF